MTVEVSALIPIVLMVLWLFFSYLFYFMNCGNKPFKQILLRTFIENRIKWSFFLDKLDMVKKLAKLPKYRQLSPYIISYQTVKI